MPPQPRFPSLCVSPARGEQAAQPHSAPPASALRPSLRTSWLPRNFPWCSLRPGVPCKGDCSAIRRQEATGDLHSAATGDISVRQEVADTTPRTLRLSCPRPYISSAFPLDRLCLLPSFFPSVSRARAASREAPHSPRRHVQLGRRRLVAAVARRSSHHCQRSDRSVGDAGAKDEVLRRWELVRAQKELAASILQDARQAVDDLGDGQRAHHVRGWWRDRNWERKQDVADLLVLDRRLVEAFAEINELDKELGLAERAGRRLVGRGSAHREQQLQQVKERVRHIAHEAGNSLARHRCQVDLLKGYSDLLGDNVPARAHAETDEAAGLESGRASRRASAVGLALPEYQEQAPSTFDVELPYSWGLRAGESSRVNLPPPPNRYSSPAAQDVLSATQGLDVTLVPIGPITKRDITMPAERVTHQGEHSSVVGNEQAGRGGPSTAYTPVAR
ncbi:hypothetical protein DMC30DRAFT_44354 [Rhodotorula diobovata]|uniref:Uncharacterized protein n=1 Tax=Rhodotorula diobovata TaxID=5288 RepID=A0A5C5G2A1_9BASI|nr:hypothetical protein DMC30DRAFT_44354 [Rhodotorula diobovata]